MCGRYTLSQQPETLAQTFALNTVPELEPRYNIAPTQKVAVVLQTTDTDSRQLQRLRWGLIPSWAKDLSIGAKLINARSETVAEKPSFRSAFKHRRCLIVADGFYEWQRQERKKQPFYFRLQDGQPFAFAGLWERWKSPEGEEITSCTILTTQANELLQPIHDRMPVILQPSYYNLWLDPHSPSPEPLQQILNPYPTDAMTAYPVSTLVNSTANERPECINSL